MAGIVRQVDMLGRIVIPKEIRETFEIKIKDPLEIFTDKECMILQKYEPGCTVCGDVSEEYLVFRSKKVCKKCVSELTQSRDESNGA